MNKFLSICIPTYNRAKFIGETIQSIIDSAKDIKGIEIVISDNASTDNTKEIVENFKLQFSDITYFCWDENNGADRNFLKVIEIASGKYCWFVGSDDKITEYSIKTILEYINVYQSDIFLCDRIMCDFNMNVLYNQTWFERKDMLFNTDNNQVIEYFKNTNSLGGVFSYLSSIIFRKQLWIEDSNTSEVIGTAYVHVYQLMNIVKKGCTIKHVSKALVYCRGDNDSFSSDGEVKRILLDFDGYFKIASFLFEDNSINYQEFISILKREYPFKKLIKIQALAKPDEIIFFNSYFQKLGWKKYQLNISYTLKWIYNFYLRLKKLRKK